VDPVPDPQYQLGTQNSFSQRLHPRLQNQIHRSCRQREIELYPSNMNREGGTLCFASRGFVGSLSITKSHDVRNPPFVCRLPPAYACFLTSPPAPLHLSCLPHTRVFWKRPFFIPLVSHTHVSSEVALYILLASHIICLLKPALAHSYPARTSRRFVTVSHLPLNHTLTVLSADGLFFPAICCALVSFLADF
jgi:hypothetical protein